MTDNKTAREWYAEMPEDGRTADGGSYHVEWIERILAQGRREGESALLDKIICSACMGRGIVTTPGYPPDDYCVDCDGNGFCCTALEAIDKVVE